MARTKRTALTADPPAQTALEKIKDWLATCPSFPTYFSVDYTDRVPANGGIFPAGLTEINRVRDILGNTTVTNQYNFGLYYVFQKAPADDVGAAENAEWIISFQEWVQAQSVTGSAPTFGDYPQTERITASNGALYEANAEGTATYMVQLSVTFTKNY